MTAPNSFVRAWAKAHGLDADVGPYAWAITTDHLADPGTSGDAGITGPSAAEGTDLLRLVERGEGICFRLYDDDGELYYSGRQLSLDEHGQKVTDPADLDETQAFAPLDEFGTGWAGATECRWRHPNGTWESL